MGGREELAALERIVTGEAGYIFTYGKLLRP